MFNKEKGEVAKKEELSQKKSLKNEVKTEPKKKDLSPEYLEKIQYNWAEFLALVPLEPSHPLRLYYQDLYKQLRSGTLMDYEEESVRY